MAALLLGASRRDLSAADSIALAGRFWRAGPRGRLLNAPGISRDAAFAADALRASAAWPADADAVLTVGALVPPDAGERLRRKAAYLLAPRRVLVRPGEGSEVVLSRADGTPAR